MEALAAFSLAGTILAFTRFGISLLNDGRELYNSTRGVLTANEQLELATADLRALLVKLKARQHPTVATNTSAEDGGNDETFQHILRDAGKIAKELAERLEGLKVKGSKGRKWESFRKAIQSAWTKDEIDSITKKLANFKDSMKTHILFSIMETLDEESLQKSSRFDRLDERTQLIMSSLLNTSFRANETAALTQEVRDQMETLIQLVRRTDKVYTDEHHRTRTKISKEQVGDRRAQFGDVAEITSRFEMLDVSEVQETKLRRRVQEDILKTLAYSAMTERYEDIVEAFPETFEWAFEESTSEQLKWSNLSEWLKEGSGVYWISGKAGSGKSTLMKHVFEDVRTRQYLRVWAKEKDRGNHRTQRIPLCLATFFFWNSGTPDQKSQSGLLRALLYQVLSSFPELVSVVFPDMWAKRYLDSIQGLPNSFEQALTVRRLTSAFQKLTQQSLVPLKLCFLVDGLDEFYGDHEELATLFKMAAMSPTVKICLSSRPWVIFEQIYGSRPSMRLQDLTYHDIEHFVNSKFNQNPAFGILEEIDPDSASLLRTEIVEKAEGVFLWVEIVVKSLISGIRNQDDIMILRQRLIDMPTELEDLYLHLVSLIEPVYLVWASQAFQIVRAARELCTDDSVGPIKRAEGSLPLSISTFFFAISENIQFYVDVSNNVSVIEKVSSAAVRTLTQELLPARCASIKTYLTARCAGLLEVPRFEQKGPNAPIQFLHRTARDFLHKHDKWSQLVQYNQNTAFDPHKSMLMASVLELAIKTTNKSAKSEKIYNIVTNAMLYAYHINLYRIPNETETVVIDSLDQIMTSWSSARKDGRKSENFHWTNRLLVNNSEISADMVFLRLATLYGLVNYVGEKLAQSDRKSAARIASMLLHILLPCEAWPKDVQPPLERPEMVSTLLHHGADPNFSRGRHPYQTTPWYNMLWHVCKYRKDSPRFQPAFARIMKLLIVAGADPNFSTRLNYRPRYAELVFGEANEFYTAESVVRRFLLPHFMEEGRELLDEMALQKSLITAKESEEDEISPPRKKKRLVPGCEINSLSPASSSSPRSSIQQIIQEQGQPPNIGSDDDISLRRRGGVLDIISPSPQPTTSAPATPPTYLDPNRVLGSTSPAADSDTSGVDQIRTFWSTVL